MAVSVQIIGRLVADAEIKTSKNGNQFVAFRMATDEFKNGNRETAWLNVTDYSDKTSKMAQYLTKGKMIALYGVETVSIYNDRNGVPQISRDIKSDRIDFVSSGKQDTEQTESAPTVAQRQEAPRIQRNTEIPPMDCGTLINHSASVPQMSTVASSDDADDDLPF